ncbi:type VII secretion target [Catellatospora sp. KI3]|uniref:type VII secretion target n=1 Tax=Catellatospora sp. KI3 TaxID=3041620 RepID=UPI002482C35D|nr:type VII secretion target [Catellatospora sp. KI3]MDI1461041.1 type VII secretion target [Catellatospora sp. KI3]
MAFRVEPEAVKFAAVSMDRSSGHLTQSAQYHDRYADFGFLDGGFILTLNQAHTEFEHLLSTRLAQAARLLAASAHELKLAADAYGNTDTVSAQRLDATYPQVQRSAVPAPFGGA